MCIDKKNLEEMDKKTNKMQMMQKGRTMLINVNMVNADPKVFLNVNLIL